MRSKRPLALLLAVLTLAVCVRYRSYAAESPDVIDTPTAELLDYGGYNVNFRAYSNGNMLSRLSFGVFKIVNLGLGWEVNRLIGDQSITVSPPALYFKIKPYDGGLVLPALALGYDGQGYFYDKDAAEYLNREKGIFIVFGREFLTPGLLFNVGGNMADFKKNTAAGFTSMTWSFENTFVFLAEYDNINYFPAARLNIGCRFYITESLNIDLAGRDLGATRIDQAGLEHAPERIIRVNYVGKF